MVVFLVVADVGRIGIGICYDIRFQELAMIYAARGESLYYNAFIQMDYLLPFFFGSIIVLKNLITHMFTLIISGAHLLCYPGAFNMTTGPLHWELLQRARCDSQSATLQLAWLI